MDYPLILIDKVDTPCSSNRINIVIELRNSILKQLLEEENEGDLPRGTIATISETFKVHMETVKTIWGGIPVGIVLETKGVCQGGRKA